MSDVAVRVTGPARPSTMTHGGSGSSTLTLARTDWKVRFFGSVLGYLWSLLRPLMLFGILYFVFSEVVGAGDDVAHFPIVLLSGMMIYFFFADTTGAAVTSLVDRESLVRKVGFPRMVVPLAVTLVATFNLLLNLVVLAVFLALSGVTPRWSWLLFPIPLRARRRARHRDRPAARGALRPLPRHQADLGRGAAGALLRHADPLPDPARAGEVRDPRARPHGQPARGADPGGAPPAARDPTPRRPATAIGGAACASSSPRRSSSS